MPKLSSADAARNAAKDLIQALGNPAPASPLNQLTDPELQALRQLAQIFDAAAPKVDPKKHPPAAAAAPVVEQPVPDPPLETMTMPKLPNTIPFPEIAAPVLDIDTGNQLSYRQLLRHPKMGERWNGQSAKEFGRLMQGIDDVAGTNTMKPIRREQVPKDRKVSFPRFVCDIRPQKAEPERVRLTVAGNNIEYPDDKSTPTADLTTIKVHINDCISTNGARMCAFDIKNFYLGTPMDRPEYMRIHLRDIPQRVIDLYKLDVMATDGWVYFEINKGMYGLPQAGILANQQLERILSKHGWYQARHTPGDWRNKRDGTSFCLVVDDFLVKYTSKAAANELYNILNSHYEAVSADWDAALFCGITLRWDYTNCRVFLSMPNYVKLALQRFKHRLPKRPQHAPHRYNVPQYGTKIQYTEPIDTSDKLSDDEIKEIQQIVGVFLYYGRAVDCLILPTLSALASEQNRATVRTRQDVHQLLDYLHTHPDAVVVYEASNMILNVDSDASYLTEPKARSRVGGHYSLGQRSNGPILTVTTVLRLVASAASEAEIGAVFVNMKEAQILRQTLKDMGYPQPPTTFTTDNSTAVALANNTIKKRRSRPIDMRYYWIQDRIPDEFNVKWCSRDNNMADFFTKFHPPGHINEQRPLYQYCSVIMAILRQPHCKGVSEPQVPRDSVTLASQPSLPLRLRANTQTSVPRSSRQR